MSNTTFTFDSDPLPTDREVCEDEKMSELIDLKIMPMLKRGEKVYVHCFGGNISFSSLPSHFVLTSNHCWRTRKNWRGGFCIIR